MPIFVSVLLADPLQLPLTSSKFTVLYDVFIISGNLSIVSVYSTAGLGTTTVTLITLEPFDAPIVNAPVASTSPTCAHLSATTAASGLYVHVMVTPKNGSVLGSKTSVPFS